MLAQAIDYHEQSLKTKTVLSFIKFKVMAEKEKENFILVKDLVKFNLKKFYLKAMLGKAKEVRWMKSGSHIAAVYRQKISLRRLFCSFRKVIQDNKAIQASARSRLEKSPKAVSVLIRWMGSFYLQERRYNDLDVFKFKQAAIDSARVPAK
jgi:hypothetical protein